MSALAKMLMGGLTDGMSPEVQKWLTPEGQAQLGVIVKDYTKKLESALVESVLNSRAVLANQKIIMEKLGVGEQFNDGKPASISDSGANQHAA